MSRLEKILKELNKLEDEGWHHEVVIKSGKKGTYIPEGELYSKDVKEETYFVTINKVMSERKVNPDVLTPIKKIEIYSQNNESIPVAGWKMEVWRSEGKNNKQIYNSGKPTYGFDSYSIILDCAVQTMKHIDKNALKLAQGKSLK